ncbi:prolyl oligopeptidase family serine peptidase [Pelomonas sp. P7]|uniref:Prolyl oligopeptidase family serine peptidase n=1 Tax=Pelomonas caseinilytica TaxID=2906763 RepID=A0ABS8XCX7_9BURK|nr:prolyl oligopeptidase family serine peptidase [Pelomonas sp. P7]MCE4538774.1 prolyl oligopeptidase family serine peptidase [Pelomonas sp. P7]
MKQTVWLKHAACVLLGLACLAAFSQPTAGPTAGAPKTTAAALPVEAFFKKGDLGKAQLSPSGRYLAALESGIHERMGVVVTDLEGKEGSHFISASEKDDVTWFSWVTDDWIVFKVNNPNYRGTRWVGSGLMSMSRDGKTSRQLIARDWESGSENSRRLTLSPDHGYVGRGAPDSLEVLVAQPHYDGNYEYRYSTLHAVNVVSGQSRVEAAPRADEWLIDGRGRPRASLHAADGQVTVMWLDPRSREWTELQKSPVHHMDWIPLAIQDEAHLLVSTSDKDGYDELREYDAIERRVGSVPILATPGFSRSIEPIYARHSDRLLGLSVLVDSVTTTWLDPTLSKLQDRVDAKLPNRVNILQCSQCERPQRVLVHSYSDTDPGMVLLFTPEKDEWKLVGRVRPQIDPKTMATMELHRTSARDGEDLPVWITRPRGAAPEKPLPAVVLVHGGPWERGTEWRWNPEGQFLASRGYLVIEPEFRGSVGYGERHFHLGFKAWGLSMQDDVTDALKFVISKGWADPGRVCIMGASYGGYATLMGLAKDPGQYRCGIAFAAVSDPRYMFDFHWNDISRQAKSYGLNELLGDRIKDEARFIATSPVEQAANIKAPLMLVHGAKDRRVPIQNGERMRDALQKANKQVEWVLYPWAGHGFPLLEDELDYYGRVERFLAKHLN